MGILDMSDTLRRFRKVVGLIGKCERWIVILTTCFNDSTTQEVNWYRHMTRLTWLLITAKHEFEKVGTASK